MAITNVAMTGAWVELAAAPGTFALQVRRSGVELAVSAAAPVIDVGSFYLEPLPYPLTFTTTDNLWARGTAGSVVRISTDILGASGSGASGGGDASAANQATQITAEQAIQATLGATTGAAVITDANGTIQQYLRGLVKRWVDALGAGTAAAALRTTLASDDPLLAATGAAADAVVAAGATGSVAAKLRRLTTDIDAIKTLLTTQAGYLDGLEGFVDNVEAALALVGTRTYGTIERVAVLSSSVQSAAITATEVLMHASTKCYVLAGSNPTAAATTGIPLEPGEKWHMRITSGHKIAVIRDTADGYLHIAAVA